MADSNVSVTGRIATALARHLRLKLPSAFVDVCPDDPKRWTELVGAGGAVLVRYSGSTWGDPKATVQTRLMRLQVFVGSKSFGKEMNGCYDLMDAVRGAIRSFRGDQNSASARVGRLWQIREDFFGEADEVWWYVQEFTTQLVQT